VRGSGISWAICKSAHCCRQITMLASHHSFFTGQMPFLLSNQQCQSTEGNTEPINNDVIHTDTHNHFTALWTLSRTSQVSWYQKVHFTIFWIFWCKMKTQADKPTTWMYCHPIQTNWCPNLCHFHHFYARCPSWHNPPN